METGHAKNIANFALLTNYCSSLGATYAPTHPNIIVAAMQDLLNKSQEQMQLTEQRVAEWRITVNDRQKAFVALQKTAVSIVNLLDASGAPPKAVKDARAIVNKIVGRSKKSSTTPPTDETTDQPLPVPTETKHSTAQTSFDQRASNFFKLIQVVKQYDLYNPNENHLTVKELEKQHENALAYTNAVSQAYIALKNARTQRDKYLYDTDVSLLPVAQDAKKYIKAIWGAKSKEFQYVSKIAFTKRK